MVMDGVVVTINPFGPGNYIWLRPASLLDRYRSFLFTTVTSLVKHNLLWSIYVDEAEGVPSYEGWSWGWAGLPRNTEGKRWAPKALELKIGDSLTLTLDYKLRQFDICYARIRSLGFDGLNLTRICCTELYSGISWRSSCRKKYDFHKIKEEQKGLLARLEDSVSEFQAEFDVWYVQIVKSLSHNDEFDPQHSEKRTSLVSSLGFMRLEYHFLYNLFAPK